MDNDRIAEIKTRFEALSTGKQRKAIHYAKQLLSAGNPSTGGRK